MKKVKKNGGFFKNKKNKKTIIINFSGLVGVK
jgi:hypothetical protein